MPASRAGAGAPPAGRVFRGLAAVAIAAGVALRLVLPFVLPYGPTPHRALEGLNDEPAHVAYVRYLADHRSFPVVARWDEAAPLATNDFEFHQPPLAYVLCAPFAWRWGRLGSRLACRLLSAAFGLLTMIAFARLLRDLGASTAMRRASLAFLALWFPHVYFCSVVSNDALTGLIAVLLAGALLRYGSRPQPAGPQMSEVAAMLAWTTLGLYTKSSMLVWLPVLLAAFIQRHRATRSGTCVRDALLVLGGSVLLAAPWYARNLALYHSLTALPLGGPAQPIGLWLQGLVRGTARSFWYPLQNLPEGSLARQALVLLGAAVLLAHAVLAARWIARHGRSFTAFALAALLALSLVAYAALALHPPAGAIAAIFHPGAEARLLFPALAAVVALLFAPLDEALAPLDEALTRAGRQPLLVPYAVALGAMPYALLLAAR